MPKVCMGQTMAECGCQHTQCETLGYCMVARIIELEAGVTDMHEGLTTVYWSGYEDGKKAMEAKLAKAVEALELYSCDDGCNDCPEHERDRVTCGWTASVALAAIKENDNG